MKLPGQNTWRAGTCMGEVGLKSNNVKVDGSTYRRIHHNLIQADKPPILDIPNKVEQLPERSDTLTPLQDPPVTPRATPTPGSPVPIGPQRSEQAQRKPACLSDYVST